MIYSGGFFSDNDKKLMSLIRNTDASDLPRLDLPFKDSRLKEMLFRYRARNYPATLREEEQQDWQEFRKQRLTDAKTLAEFQEELLEAQERADSHGDEVLAALRSYVTELTN